jgi:hypothetical protein
MVTIELGFQMVRNAIYPWMLDFYGYDKAWCVVDVRIQVFVVRILH